MTGVSSSASAGFRHSRATVALVIIYQCPSSSCRSEYTPTSPLESWYIGKQCWEEDVLSTLAKRVIHRNCKEKTGLDAVADNSLMVRLMVGCIVQTKSSIHPVRCLSGVSKERPSRICSRGWDTGRSRMLTISQYH